MDALATAVAPSRTRQETPRKDSKARQDRRLTYLHYLVKIAPFVHCPKNKSAIGYISTLIAVVAFRNLYLEHVLLVLQLTNLVCLLCHDL